MMQADEPRRGVGMGEQMTAQVHDAVVSRVGRWVVIGVAAGIVGIICLLLVMNLRMPRAQAGSEMMPVPLSELERLR
ncbi:MAG: hypothetical protein J0L63_12355 [Anaerolineae bacterium]|nr:hypothetical protein [Anaerolineae bacterium]